MPTPTRRSVFTMSLAAAALLGLGALPRPALALGAADATTFIHKVGDELVAILNGSSGTDKQAKLQELVNRVVDVDAVAKFCLGRYWRTATPDQQKQYLELFRQVLMRNLTGKIGDFQGVSYTLGRTTPRDDNFGVGMVVMRPGTANANVEWIVSMASGAPLIIDLIAEGTSLRLTQRSDYASYLARNNNSVDALLAAMRHQLSQPS
jgi:phospholipid transport system substrate-binding protein